jgi:hypothetical protein
MKPLDQLEARSPIRAEMLPLEIASPGSYYLVEDIGAAGGITISADDVTLDLNGFTLSGGLGSGIYVAPGLEGITIRNGTVRDWEWDGVLAHPASVHVEGVVALDNGNNGIYVGHESVVEQCRADGNSAAGIASGLDSVVRDSTACWNGTTTEDAGIFVHSGSVVVSCSASNNTGTGISTGPHVVVNDCATRGNSVAGIRGSEGTRIVGSVANSNGDVGLEVGTDGEIVDCVSSSNGHTGIKGDSGTLIRGCGASLNQIGIETGGGASILRCIARGNTGRGIVAGHGSMVEGCTVRENQDDGIFATYGVHVVGNTVSWNGSVVGGDGAGIYVEGVDNRIDGNLVLSNDRGIQAVLGQNTIVRNSASGNTVNYELHGGNDIGPIGPAATSTSPWANIEF